MSQEKDLAARVAKHSIRLRRRLGQSYNPAALIDRLLRLPLNVEDRLGLLTFKIGELRLKNESEEALRAIEEYISMAPKHPEAWMMLASYYREDAGDQAKAILASGVAVAVANLDGNFVRQALGERMRALLASNCIGEANACLKQLIEYTPPRSSIDIAPEFDFLVYPNARSLDEALVSAYRATS